MIHDVLGWFNDQVYGNLVANLLCEVPIWLIALWRFEKHHKRHQQEIRKVISEQIKASQSPWL